MPKKKLKKRPVKFIYNIFIVVLAIAVVGFIFSFAQKSWKDGVTISKPHLSDTQKEQLAVDIYEANPILDIKIEVMNGCGEKGIAHKVADFLRIEHQLDIVRSENADNWDYERTVLIRRSDDVTKLEAVAEVLELDKNDKNRVLVSTDSDSDVDLTLILGSDYRSVKPLRLYLANL